MPKTYRDEEETASTTGHVCGKAPEALTLCFLSCPKDASDAFVGALLLTDSRGRPEHFAFVEPLTATRLQRLLYGATLEEYVKVDVITQKLWEGLPKKPDVLFVDARDLIAAKRLVGLPTAYLEQAPNPDGDAQSLSTIKFDAGNDQADRAIVGEIVGALEPYVNLVEPFARMRQALNVGLKKTPA